VDAVRQYLTEQELIPAPQIAVATGQQKELDGVNLFDPGCPVRYVITVEALKEGWDCSFAYVLAGLQSVESAKDVEQLLGRVLRMPYARRRTQEALNKSYAHVVARSFAQAASRLKDRMVQNMGFDPMDAGALFTPPQLTMPMPDGSTRTQPKVPDLALELSGADCAKVVESLPPEVAAAVQVLPTSTGATLLLSGGVPRATVVLACEYLADAVPTAQKAEVTQQLSDHLALIDQCSAPSELGRPFAAVPQLCLNLGDQLTVVDKTLLGSLGRMDLLAEKVQLAQFELQARGLTSEIDVDALSKGARLTHTLTSTTQQGLDLAHLQTLSENDLMRWLDKELGQHDIKQPDLQKWLLLVLGHLQEERHFTLPELVRSRYRLVPAMLAEIERLRQRAVAKGFQASLPGMVTAEVSQGHGYEFQFDPGIYPAKNLYRGSFVFKKHYYGNGLIHDLQKKIPKGLLKNSFAPKQSTYTRWSCTGCETSRGRRNFRFGCPPQMTTFTPTLWQS
jgi:type III restriction enzyme